MIRLSRSLHKFSSQKKKIQTVGFANTHIESVKSLGYKLKQPIQFVNGRFLIYRSNSSKLRFISDYFLHIAGCAFFGYLIYIRYNMDALPVIFHAYVGGVALTLLLFMRKFLKLQSVVREIYLLQGGKATEIVFRNSLKRRMFGEPLSSTYYNSLFVPPREQENSFKVLNEFPRDLMGVTSGQRIGTYWRKLYSNDGNFILIPQRYDFMHTEILNQVMNGKVILLS